MSYECNLGLMAMQSPVPGPTAAPLGCSFCLTLRQEKWDKRGWLDLSVQLGPWRINKYVSN